PIHRLPHLSISLRLISPDEDAQFSDDKADFINFLMMRVWNEDFGKFTELFYKNYFKIPTPKECEFETLKFTDDTVNTSELLMKYLYTSSTEVCLGFFESWIEFYKIFRCSAAKKEIIFKSLKEFICRFCVEISKNFYITNELLRRRTAIVCEIYDLEDKKMVLLSRGVVV
ncbi:MAG: hypothetical protein IKE41_02865, partial [Clostridia bacterium]|nr:hypothetical protein [Clostridia bacterium]